MLPEYTEFLDIMKKALPSDLDISLCEWAKLHCNTPGSPLGETYDINHTPWMREPLNSLSDRSIKETTLIAPIQSGKSQVSEVFLSYTISINVKGDIMVAYETDDKAEQRWKSGLRKKLLDCNEVKRVWPVGDKKRDNICNTNFDSFNLRVNGVKSKNNLSSFTVSTLILDECHNYENGKMALAKGRTAGVANFKILNVSTGSETTHELYNNWQASTQQEYMWKCPCCNKYHVPHFRVDDKTGGGLHYDKKNSMMANGKIDYAKLKESVFYQFPCCGHKIKDEPEIRMTLASTGRYSSPIDGSNPKVTGFRVPGLVVTTPVWATLVLEKINALESIKHGSIDKFKIYIMEREADFFDSRRHNQEARSEPSTKKKLSQHIIKKGPLVTSETVVRVMGVDAQAGINMKNPHYYYVIRDLARSSSTVVAEGRADDIAALQSLIETHQVYTTQDDGSKIPNVLIDGQWNTDFLYEVAHENDWLIIRGHNQTLYKIAGKPSSGTCSYRVDHGYEHKCTSTGIYTHVDTIWHDTLLSKERLFKIKQASQYNWIIPDDVSGIFKEHNAAWDRVEKTTDTGPKVEYKKISDRSDDDLAMCEVYLALYLDLLREEHAAFSLDLG